MRRKRDRARLNAPTLFTTIRSFFPIFASFRGFIFASFRGFIFASFEGFIFASFKGFVFASFKESSGL
eukprot:376953-Amorphochlora_amoeboformis.AAC.1